MIDEGTTITRLLDKLEAAGLIQRERSDPDRRQVVCRVTAAGRKLLRELDPRVDALDEALAGGLGAARLRAFIAALDEIRAAAGDRGAAR
jgi:DNA-binding MarR family transcriptional regulator